MRIVFIDIQNYRGIKKLAWAPSAQVNCLIGPGDSTKTTILDAIELVLNPRAYVFADDSDFFDLDVTKPILVTVTLSNLPSEFKSDDRYGMHLRGWHQQESIVEDEPNENLEDALSVRVTIDRSLEARWSIFNDRIEKEGGDPPTIRYKDAKQISTSRLGAYAERHLSWGRQSVLMKMESDPATINLQLADASRAARETFRKSNQDVFKKAVSRVEKLGNKFSVPIRRKYVAELDVQGVSITAGGISLHDGELPLRRLGTGSSRLLVSAIQYDAGNTHIALIDEIEHGLEPHRIARLLNHIKSPGNDEKNEPPPQIFMTTHSPVVIRELTANDIFTVRSNNGNSEVRSAAGKTISLPTAQRYIRRSPEAFLARRILVGEGRTEQGLLRGLDSLWSQRDKDSFSLRGVIAIDGGGIPEALNIAEHLLDLGYEVALLLDTDKALLESQITCVQTKGGVIFEWKDSCSIEERIFLDVPWQTVIALVNLAVDHVGPDSVRAQINNECRAKSLSEISALDFPNSLDNDIFRRTLGMAAKKDKRPWFKDIARGEQLAEILEPCLHQIPDKPLSKTISSLRQWVDA